MSDLATTSGRAGGQGRFGAAIDRSWDHLEAIASTLGDLRGTVSLVHELIQNADDAEGATTLSFRFTEQALVVQDNGGFTKCSDLAAPRCPWEDEGRRPCDFHAFARLGAATKKHDPNTTGAFGVGFISVYQVTDAPEVLSAGVHWIVDEEQRRILPCRGCDENHRRAGTRIVLPWADHETWLRQKLDADVVTADRQRELLREVIDAIPECMLFLRQLKHIDVFDGEERVARYRRAPSDGGVKIIGPRGAYEWLILEDSFEATAEPLRAEHSRIGDRRAEVSIALSATNPVDGRLYATLPTQVATELPAHINASFFPRRDRKGVLLEAGAENDWNRAAIAAAAELLATNAEAIADALGPRRFWALVKAASRLDGHHSPDVRALAPVWDSLAEALPSARVMWTAAGRWEVVRNTCLIPRTQRAGALLAALDVPTVSKEIRADVPHRRLGIRTIDLDRLVAALEYLQIRKGSAQEELPTFLQRADQRKALGALLAHLVERSEVDEALQGRLRALPIWAATDGHSYSFEASYLVDKNTAAAFSSLTDVPLIIWSTRGPAKALGQLGDWFDTSLAIEALAAAGSAAFEGGTGRRVLRWLQAHRAELLEDDIATLKDVPCVPTSSGARSPSEAVRAGGFKDSLGLTGVVDERETKGVDGILNLLGVGRLSFVDYMRDHLPRAVASGDELDSAGLVALIRESARHWDQIERQPALAERLADLAWIPCQDGLLRSPREVYFADARVARVLASDAPMIVEAIRARSAAGGLLRTLGTTHIPRPRGVVTRVERLVEDPPTPARKRSVKAIIHHLAGQGTELADPSSPLQALKRIGWLAAEGDAEHWHRPDTLFLTRHRRLFTSSGRFIWLSPEDQRSLGPTLSALGIAAQPTVDLVAEHVRHLAALERSADGRILGWLNTRSQDPDVALLAEVPFLPGRDGGLHRPDSVFRRSHSLSERFPVLEQRVGKYARLLDALGVLPRPTGEHAIAALVETAEEIANGATAPRETVDLMRACWRIIGLDQLGDMSQLDGLAVVPSRDGSIWSLSDVVLDDYPAATAWLSPDGRRRVISDQALAAGLARAGVEPLSARLRAQIANRSRARRSPALEQELMDRQPQLARIVLAEHGDLPRLLEFGKRLKVRSLPELRIRHSLAGLDEVPPGQVTSRAAHYDRATGELFVAGNGSSAQPDHLAPCLKDALFPAAGPSVTFPLVSVLDSTGADAADAFLTRHGFPELPLETWQEIRDVVADWEAGREPVEDPEGWPEGIDDEDAPVDEDASAPQPEEPDTEDERGPGPAPQEEPSEPDSAPADEEGPPDDAQGEGATETRGPGGSKPDDDAAASGDADRSGGQENGDRLGGDKGTGKPPRRSAADRRLVSYVGQTDRDSRNEHAGDRSADGDAGVERVLEHLADELAGTGLRARKMPDKNKGYDILVEDPEGEPVRYIEVKSTDDKWGLRGVGLSSAQFRHAQEHGDHFWLYVVEHLYQYQARLWWIQDPARKVTTFQYDDRWSRAAEGSAWVPGARRPDPPGPS